MFLVFVFSPDLAPFSQFILISYGIPWLVSSLLITSVGLVITEKVIEHGVLKALMRKRIRSVFKSPGVPYRIPFSYFFSIFLQNIAKRSQGELATVASQDRKLSIIMPRRMPLPFS